MKIFFTLHLLIENVIISKSPESGIGQNSDHPPRHVQS
jgi:hypothetical protein